MVPLQVTSKKIPLAKRNKSPYLLLANIGQMLTVHGEATPRCDRALQETGLIEDAAALCG
jgi:hypothetical protein